MKHTINKIIAFTDRVLWASQMASLTSPTYWGRSTHGHESSPWISSVRANESADLDELQVVRNKPHATCNEVQAEVRIREYAGA